MNSTGSQKKNEVTEGLLIFDPGPLMGVVITAGGCSEQECIVSVYCGLSSQSVFAGCTFNQECVLSPGQRVDEEGRSSMSFSLHTPDSGLDKETLGESVTLIRIRVKN